MKSEVFDKLDMKQTRPEYNNSLILHRSRFYNRTNQLKKKNKKIEEKDLQQTVLPETSSQQAPTQSITQSTTTSTTPTQSETATTTLSTTAFTKQTSTTQEARPCGLLENTPYVDLSMKWSYSFHFMVKSLDT
jgi:hypothetical protein